MPIFRVKTLMKRPGGGGSARRGLCETARVPLYHNDDDDNNSYNDDRVVPATTTMRNRLEQALTRGGQREGDGEIVRGETVVVVGGD